MQQNCMSSQTFDRNLYRFDRGVAATIPPLNDLSGFNEARKSACRISMLQPDVKV
jgi:hypothetical protein